jgi:hypothetical protein
VNILDAFEEFWPGSSLEARDALIWITPYPFKDKEHIVQCLRGLREKYGPNIGDAIDGEMKAFDDEWAAHMEQEHLQHMINLQGAHP